MRLQGTIPHRSPRLHVIARNPSRIDELRDALRRDDLDVIGKRGESILHAAVRSTNVDAVKLVLHARPDLVAVEDNRCNTPLHTALKWRARGRTCVGCKFEIVKLLLDGNRVDLNRFRDYTWVATESGAGAWRLNVLRFAIIYSPADPIMDVLESHGAVIGQDSAEARDPFPDGVKRFGPRYGKRIPFFEGLVCHESRLRHTLGQQLVLRRYPAAVHFGSPSLRSIIISSSTSSSHTSMVERLIGNLFPAPCLDNAFEYRIGSEFIMRVLAMEGGIAKGLIVGQMLRAIRLRARRECYESMWDVLLVDFLLSSHQQAASWDYRTRSYLSWEILELEELQAPVLFETADLV